MTGNDHSPWGKPPGENRPPPKKSLLSFIIMAITVVILAFIITWVVGDGLTGGQGANLLYDFLLLALIGAGLIGHIVSDPGQALRNVAGWIIIFGILGLGYSIWNGGSRLASELNPSRGEIAGNAITFRADRSGHYFVRAAVNNTEIDFMVDTGATHVVLNMADAEKIGFNPEQLVFDQPASTANGIVYSAAVKLNRIDVGPISVESVDGYVNQGDLE